MTECKDREVVLEALSQALPADGKPSSLKVLDALRWKVRRFLLEIPGELTIKEVIDALEDPITVTEYKGVER